MHSCAIILETFSTLSATLHLNKYNPVIIRERIFYSLFLLTPFPYGLYHAQVLQPVSEHLFISIAYAMRMKKRSIVYFLFFFVLEERRKFRDLYAIFLKVPKFIVTTTKFSGMAIYFHTMVNASRADQGARFSEETNCLSVTLELCVYPFPYSRTRSFPTKVQIYHKILSHQDICRSPSLSLTLCMENTRSQPFPPPGIKKRQREKDRNWGIDIKC